MKYESLRFWLIQVFKLSISHHCPIFNPSIHHVDLYLVAETIKLH